MKKLTILILICFAQTICAQTSKTTTTKPAINKESQNVDKNKVYNIDAVNVKPEFEGGLKKFQKFISNNTRYPDEELQVKGTVEVNYIVEKDGTLSNINVTKDIGYDTGAEAIRVLKKSPKWIPGTHNHRLVRVLYYLSIPIPPNNPN
ncbi:hypothetical protein HNP37_001408 [Flavobacterium nitrogenifigens]|uniref:TonB C-terminal domain-containing protein n=2 Tax=Flavobacterium TaxID=237 RepID=A0A7W7N7I5_9FLAO|nr:MULTISPECIES: energy transducer TonB [Flavobacterium]MBB4801347.1 hypothetical protein [Flavobacterium nitrogenifigens]MBB6386304.1 hypothetical protein [Flavobacterium notoginsengisoli]